MNIFLDATPLAILARPNNNPRWAQLNANVQTLLANGHYFFIAEITDYEARRELERKNATAQLSLLNQLKAQLKFVPINSAAMLDAAKIWAHLRNTNRQTASDKDLDGDVILAAHAKQFAPSVVLTSNTKHLARMCTAVETTKALDILTQV